MSGDSPAPATTPVSPSPIDASASESTFHLSYRDGSGVFHPEWPIAKVEEAINDLSGLLWIDILGPDEHSGTHLETWLCEHFHFHHLAVEDALAETHIPKVDDWGSYLYIVFHVARIVPEIETLELQELDIFLGKNFLITYHTVPLPILDQDRQSIERDPRDRLRQGADHLLVRFLELAIDQSLKAIEELDDQVDTIQNAVIENASPKNLKAIFRIKRSAARVHRMIGPMREVLNRLARDPYSTIREQHRVYFRDVYDHLVRLHDISESLRDLVAGALDTYLSVSANRTNEIMKALTVVTVMFLPLTFLGGFFGMNFFGETLNFTSPLPKHLLFWGTIVLMAVTPWWMYRWVRRKGWY